MKAGLLPRSPIDLLLIVFVLWFGSYMSDYLLWARGGPKPLYFYIAVILLAGLYALARGAASGSLDILRDTWIRRYLVLLLAWLVYGVLTFLESSQSDIALQALIRTGEMVMLGGALSALMLDPRRLRLVAAAFVLLSVFDVGLFVFDFLHPMFSQIPGRAAGLYGNPNVAGDSLAFMMTCGLGSVPKRLRWPFVMACGLGILLTFSREAWLVWGISVAWLGWQSDTRKSTWRAGIVVLSLVVGIGFLIAVFSGELGTLILQTPLGSHLNANTLSRLGVGSSSADDFSTVRRTDLIWYSLQSATQAPLFGHGSGYVYEWAFPVGPHNMYLRFLVEGGFLGLLFYLAMLWLFWRASSGLERVVVLELIIASFFSHNLLEIPTVLIVMTFLMARNALKRRQLRREEEFPHYGAATA